MSEATTSLAESSTMCSQCGAGDMDGVCRRTCEKGQARGHEQQQQPPMASDSSPHPSTYAPAPTKKPMERALPLDWRRRSADVGGLHLAAASSSALFSHHHSSTALNADEEKDGEPMGLGLGWMGGCNTVAETSFAELLSDMYTETRNSVIDNCADLTPVQLTDATRSRLIYALDRWNFEPHCLSEDDVAGCAVLLFEALFRIEGMKEAVSISIEQISAFVAHLRRIYRYENTYHNFEHALDVLQACQSYLKSAGMVPPPTILLRPNTTWKLKKRFDKDGMISCLGMREIFILYIAAIGHDVGHPGLTNVFMKNAQTPLSVVFDHSSALERLHCQLLLRVMKHHGMSGIIEEPIHGPQLKQLLWQAVMVTDMSVHVAWMTQFEQVAKKREHATLHARQVLVVQALLKNADISNPTRPLLVSKHWAKALMSEWTTQSNLEEEYNLQQTLYPSHDDPLKEARSQIFFIKTFVKPLLKLTHAAIPTMEMYNTHCKANLSSWEKKEKACLKEISKASNGRGKDKASCLPLSSASASASTATSATSYLDCYASAFPLTLPKCSSSTTCDPLASLSLSTSQPSTLLPLPRSSRANSRASQTSQPRVPSQSQVPQSQMDEEQAKERDRTETSSESGESVGSRTSTSTSISSSTGVDMLQPSLSAQTHSHLRSHGHHLAIRGAASKGISQRRRHDVNPERPIGPGPLDVAGASDTLDHSSVANHTLAVPSLPLPPTGIPLSGTDRRRLAAKRPNRNSWCVGFGFDLGMYGTGNTGLEGPAMAVPGQALLVEGE